MKRLAAILALLSACAPDASPPAAKPPEGKRPEARPDAAAPKTVASDPNLIRFEAPAAWVKETPSSSMRKAQYKVPDKEKKAKDAELALFYFGDTPAMVQANIDRWIAQMQGGNGKPETLEGKCKVTLVDLSGTYAGDRGAAPQTDARMLAAVVEASGGPWYFKLVGAAETVGDWRDEFVALLKGARK